VISAATTAAAGGAVAVAAAGTTAAGAALAAGSVIPIVGWVFDALVIIGEAIASASAKRQTKFVIQQTKDHINTYAQAAQAEIDAEQLAIGQQVYPAAQTLAASNQALGSLPDWLREGASKIQVDLIKKVGDLIADTGIVGAKLVGDKRGAALAAKKKAQWDANSDRVQQLFAGKLKNPYRMFADGLDAIGRTLGDTQGVHVINQKCAQLQSAAYADIDAWKAQTEAAMNTPDYAQAVTVNIALALRGDPTFTSQVTQLDAQNKMLANYFNNLDGTSSTAGGAGSLIAMLAGIAGAVWAFKH